MNDPTQDALDVLEFVCGFYAIPRREMLAKNRKEPLARYRKYAMYLARELTGASFPEIGAAFDRNHASIFVAHEDIAGLVACRGDEYQHMIRLREAWGKRMKPVTVYMSDPELELLSAWQVGKRPDALRDVIHDVITIGDYNPERLRA